ncbi:MAG TPA: hypothetical protein VJV78_36490 [Polyangiales bacterium]|nr:hypothetical protein [Polyangiales bacterium]
MSDPNKTAAHGRCNLQRMNKLSQAQFLEVERFLWLSARLLERARFTRLFRDGAREPVLWALRGYQNSDGGFGQAIEPDFRGPISQPLGVDFALRVLDELQQPEPAVVQAALGFLSHVTAADGGLPNTLPETVEYPRAPWWEPAPGAPGCLLPTASILGLLYKWRVEHRWLQPATAFCWSAAEGLLRRAADSRERLQRLQVAYEARATLVFLDHAPDRARAERLAAELGRALAGAGLIAIEPDPAAEAALPLDYAAEPGGLAQRWFEPKVLERHLDAMLEARAADGGWQVPWLVWTPLAGLEWRGVLTLERLKTLRAYGRA